MVFFCACAVNGLRQDGAKKVVAYPLKMPHQLADCRKLVEKQLLKL